MNIEHLAIWVRDIECVKAFYEAHLGACASQTYCNSRKNFTSYFLAFDSGARIELMQRPDLVSRDTTSEQFGYAHVAFSLGSKQAVDVKTAELLAAGVSVADGPRTTGDGYYESVVLDPEGNRIELTV